MYTIVISGHSDDLIEIDGDIAEEFQTDTNGPFYVGTSDGSLLRITYDGMWNINVLRRGLGTMVEHHRATDEDDDYSDRVTLMSELKFEFVVGGQVAQND